MSIFNLSSYYYTLRIIIAVAAEICSGVESVYYSCWFPAPMPCSSQFPEEANAFGLVGTCIHAHITPTSPPHTELKIKYIFKEIIKGLERWLNG